MKSSKIVSIVVACLWLGVLCVWSGVTVLRILDPKVVVRENDGGNAKPKTKQETIRADLLKYIWHKDELLDINGGWARLLGQRLFNKTLKLNNGYLATPGQHLDTREIAKQIKMLAAWCERNGFSYLFVLSSYKIDRENTLVPRSAFRDHNHETADELLASLDSVRCVDVRKAIGSSPAELAECFLKTDHHWNMTGAFKVFPYVARAILEKIGEDCDSIRQLSPDFWLEKELGRSFLGTHGRRTGSLYAGMDKDFKYFVPTGETDFMKVSPHVKKFARGSFEQAMIDSNALVKPQSRFFDNAYSMYETDRAYTKNLNPRAPVKKRILVIKDSFALPVCAFLSTVFSEVSLIDLRYYKDMSLTSFISIDKPDCVVSLINVRSLGSVKPHFVFGDCTGGLKGNLSPLACKTEVAIAAMNKTHNYATLAGGFISGSILKLSIEDVNVTEGTAPMAKVGIYDWTNKKMVSVDCFGTDMNIPQSVYLTVPNKASDYRLLLYAGDAGQTAGNAVIYRGIKLEVAEGVAK